MTTYSGKSQYKLTRICSFSAAAYIGVGWYRLISVLEIKSWTILGYCKKKSVLNITGHTNSCCCFCFCRLFVCVCGAGQELRLGWRRRLHVDLRKPIPPVQLAAVRRAAVHDAAQLHPVRHAERTQEWVSVWVCVCECAHVRPTVSLSLSAVWPLTQPLNSLSSYRRSVSKQMEITNGLQFHFSPCVCLWNTSTDAAVQLPCCPGHLHTGNVQFIIKFHNWFVPFLLPFPPSWSRLPVCWCNMLTWWWQYFWTTLPSILAPLI